MNSNRRFEGSSCRRDHFLNRLWFVVVWNRFELVEIFRSTIGAETKDFFLKRKIFLAKNILWKKKLWKNAASSLRIVVERWKSSFCVDLNFGSMEKICSSNEVSRFGAETRICPTRGKNSVSCRRKMIGWQMERFSTSVDFIRKISFSSGWICSRKIFRDELWQIESKIKSDDWMFRFCSSFRINFHWFLSNLRFSRRSIR